MLKHNIFIESIKLLCQKAHVRLGPNLEFRQIWATLYIRLPSIGHKNIVIGWGGTSKRRYNTANTVPPPVMVTHVETPTSCDTFSNQSMSFSSYVFFTSTGLSKWNTNLCKVVEIKKVLGVYLASQPRWSYPTA